MYVLVVDYFSQYIKISKLSRIMSEEVIQDSKSIFAQHDVLRSDNQPQYSSYVFQQFSNKYGFDHVTSYPKYTQSNGEAKHVVQKVKHLHKKSDNL